MLAAMLLPFLLMPSALASECDLAAVEAHIQAAQQAFLSMAADQFRQERRAISDDIGCLKVPVEPELAAQVHTLVALEAFLDRDEERSIAALHAVRRIQPDQPLGDWLPEEHPISYPWYMAKRLQPRPAVAFSERGVEILVDGRPADARVPNQPAILQNIAGGKVVDSILVLPPASEPTWAAAAPPRLTPDIKRRLILGSVAVGSAASTAALFAVSNAAHDRVLSYDLAYGEVDEVSDRANTFSIAGIANAAVTLGVTTALVIT